MVTERRDPSASFDVEPDRDPDAEQATEIYEPATHVLSSGRDAIASFGGEEALPAWAKKALARDAEPTAEAPDGAPAPAFHRAHGPASTFAPAPSPALALQERTALDSPVAESRYDHPALGKVVAGRYKIERLIGIGGMADVFEARHIELGRRVAVKVVAPALDVRGEIALRLKREARAAAALASDHVVEILDVGEDARLGIYMVMELLSGEDLERFLRGRGALDPFVACGVALQCCRALERAHAAGIVHRDLKPSNVVLSPADDGSLHVKLVDFGIAKVLSQVNGETRGGITRTGTVVGTPQYMSPEQAKGLESVDARADVYSLGAVLYEMLTGKPPFAELPTYEQTLLQVMTQPAPPVSVAAPQVPAGLVTLVADMMRFDREARVATVSDVRARILALYPALAVPALPYPAGRGREQSVAPLARSLPPAPTDARAPGELRLSRRAGIAAVATVALLFGANLAWLVASTSHARSAAGATEAPPPVEAPAVPAVDAGMVIDPR